MYNSKVLASNVASVCTDEHKAKRVTEIKPSPGVCIPEVLASVLIITHHIIWRDYNNNRASTCYPIYVSRILAYIVIDVTKNRNKYFFAD